VTSTSGPTHPPLPSVSGKERSAPVAGGPPSPGGRAPAPAEALAPGLLERVRARDPEALGVFFDRYFDQVFGLVLRLLGDRTAAEDVTQEVFLKVHRAAHQMDAARDPAPWLAAIATNACRDVWRSGAWRLGRRTASLDDDPALAGTLGSRAGDPERLAVARERERLVQQAIAALPEPLRITIVLHDYQGLSHQDIAAITGVEHAAARKRYSRALAALAKRLRGVLG
jgi:RNA polymerase sigma-70 factor, ECF subfamily